MNALTRPRFSCRWPFSRGVVLLGILGAWLVRPAVGAASVPETTTSPHGDLSLECSLCHDSAAWKPVRISKDFDHAKMGFALDGAHASVECTSCHTSLKFADVGTQCVSCHEDVHEGQFGVDCERCHQTQSFIDRPAQVDMHRTTRFPLTGSHVTLDCDQCHTPSAQGGATSFVNTPTDCYACHQSDFAAAKSPDHMSGHMSQDCSECHSTVMWEGTQLAGGHSFFPLTGGHGGLGCDDCHVGNQFNGTRSECYSCHEADYRTTSDPDHGLAGFSTDCASCHTIASWSGVSYRHVSFELTGSHRGLDCSTCHSTGVYAGLATDCYSCHQQDYAAAADPNHVQSQFDTDCTTCHTTVTWVGATFDHTSFPLTGGHSGLECSSCHASGTFAGIDADCYACHKPDYDGTTNPEHVAAGFGTDCASCHDINAWEGATFDHDAAYFPVYSGSHRDSWNECADCHPSSSSYATFTCISCHEHNQTNMDSKHQGRSNYSYDSNRCYDCHPRGRS